MLSTSLIFLASCSGMGMMKAALPASHTSSRQKRIKAFQEAPGFGVLVLSPVAVGFGANIQAANHVVHYTRT
jgi:SNF2 family DNA or RNA helicase